MLIIILQKGTRLFCSSSHGLVTLISMGETQDGCTMVKVYNVHSSTQGVRIPKWTTKIYQAIMSGKFDAIVPNDWKMYPDVINSLNLFIY